MGLVSSEDSSDDSAAATEVVSEGQKCHELPQSSCFGECLWQEDSSECELDPMVALGAIGAGGVTQNPVNAASKTGSFANNSSHRRLVSTASFIVAMEGAILLHCSAEPSYRTGP